MLFNSVDYFLGFLPIVFGVFYALSFLNRPLLSKIFLIAISIYFYNRLDHHFLWVIIASSVLNFIAGLYLSKDQTARRALVFWVSIAINIGLLFHFKYTLVLIKNLVALGYFSLSIKEILLPLGLSYLTFQQLGFLTDVYGKVCKISWRDADDFFLFSFFFPKLISGPILRYREFVPQLKRPEFLFFNMDKVAVGLILFMVGLAKKTVIADTLLEIHTQGFKGFATLGVLESWVLSISYTLQVYFDFSGYTDMALGSALMIGLTLPSNFDRPLGATSIIGYWQRWHMSLTRFLTTYVFSGILRLIRKTTFMGLVVATFITMLVSGIWHGASLTFLIFGCLHGLALIINHIWRKTGRKISALASWPLVFIFLLSVNMFFFASSPTNAVAILKRMYGFDGIVNAGIGHFSALLSQPSESYLVLLTAFLLAVLGWTAERLSVAVAQKPERAIPLMVAVTYVTIIWGHLDSYSYVYFKF
jgi:D-alanyl-lipoteichoic acid acyltransferase DltB (MBOAT superfamily)